jgi:gamma-glutamyltranspeptidase / glutathione hydrolase
MLVGDPQTGKLHAPSAGEIFKNPSLAATFRSVAKDGKKGFYEGRIAEAIVERTSILPSSPDDVAISALKAPLFIFLVIRSKGGVMTLDDLKAHTSTAVSPISYSYGGDNGFTLHECPPNGQGLTALIALGIIEALEESGKVNLRDAEHNGTVWLHTLMQVTRLHISSTGSC